MFCRIRVSFEYSKVSVLENRGHFLEEKVSGKGSLLILENNRTSYLLHLSGGTGGVLHLRCVHTPVLPVAPIASNGQQYVSNE